MNMNNKGVSKLIVSLFAVMFISSASIFTFLLVKNLYSDEILPPMIEHSLTIIEQNGNNTDMYNMISEQQGNYDNLDFEIDLIFLMSWIGSFITLSITAALLPKMNKLNLFLSLFIGVILLLIGLNYLDQILTWFVNQFIDNTFSTSETYLPIFNFFVENFIIIMVFSYVWFLMINQFNNKPEEELGGDVDSDASFQPVEEDGNFTNQGGIEQ